MYRFSLFFCLCNKPPFFCGGDFLSLRTFLPPYSHVTLLILFMQLLAHPPCQMCQAINPCLLTPASPSCFPLSLSVIFFLYHLSAHPCSVFAPVHISSAVPPSSPNASIFKPHPLPNPFLFSPCLLFIPLFFTFFFSLLHSLSFSFPHLLSTLPPRLLSRPSCQKHQTIKTDFSVISLFNRFYGAFHSLPSLFSCSIFSITFQQSLSLRFSF